MHPLPNLSPFVFRAKNIQSSPSLVLNSGNSITWKLNEKTSEYFHQLCVRESSPGSYSCPCVSCPCPCRPCSYRTSVLHVGLTPFTGLKSACEPCPHLCMSLYSLSCSDQFIQPLPHSNQFIQPLSHHSQSIKN